MSQFAQQVFEKRQEDIQKQQDTSAEIRAEYRKLRTTSKAHARSGNADNHQDETSALIEPYLRPRKEAWLALALFCALLCMQCCVWNTWGPIAGSSLLAFPSWDQSLIALLSNWGCISYITCCVPCCWFLHNKGLLVNIICLLMPLQMAAILSTLATFIRCVSSKERIFTITAHTAAILNGLSGVILGPATALVSAVWFPPGERTTATGIC
ncbi:PREDICTED: disrupted in renal carcinoma protein 2-like [Dinoponera quadriceps]|uniref:Disrupted in renal carcinoma protein 2-like n=1 Tax=Dinoponera quadriceps TaxID=609295 RepID=A0A6P3WPQ3_DINQU|nr:PREDICTED: disrupted in renal carcinoma protein 2-like [Dinoponera quadriceps]